MKRLVTWTLVLAVVLSLVSMPAIAATEGKTEVVLWNRLFEDWNQAWCKQMVEEFNADPNQQYYVTQEFVDGAAWDEKVTAARAAGTMPDMLLMNYGAIPWGASLGLYLPLENLIAQDAWDDLYPNVLAMVSQGDHMYAYPQMVEPAVVMYYRKDLLEAAGFTAPPKTWAEFIEVAQALTTADMYGATFNSEWSMWGWEFTAAGHWPITDDWSAANCQDQGYVDLLTFMKDLYDSQAVPAQQLEWYNGSARLIGDESVAMTFSGSWGIADLMKNYPDMVDKIGVAPAPTKDGSPFHTTVGGWTYVIDAKAKQPEGAAAYITWLLGSDPTRAASFFEAANFSKYSPRASVDEYLTANTAAKDDEWMQAISSQIIPTAISEPLYAWDFSANLLTAMGEVIVNGQTPEDALQVAADAINQYIQNNDYASKKP
ncbi:MAG: extracellular solute-binding protein [Bacillota bacterium]